MADWLSTPKEFNTFEVMDELNLILYTGCFLLGKEKSNGVVESVVWHIEPFDGDRASVVVKEGTRNSITGDKSFPKETEWSFYKDDYASWKKGKRDHYWDLTGVELIEKAIKLAINEYGEEVIDAALSGLFDG